MELNTIVVRKLYGSGIQIHAKIAPDFDEVPFRRSAYDFVELGDQI